MNKIRFIKQLKARQKKLEQRKVQLEKAIRYDWRDLKETIKPRNVAGKVFAHFLEKDHKTGNSSDNTLSQLAAVVTRIGVEKAEEKVAQWMSKKY